ncbi:MAG: Ig-like domain-containing protein, partial [Deltaproteobacteria bacterium]|nr:Ig-like domain-containing protein [Deltaproteobacteria bacterium]
CGTCPAAAPAWTYDWALPSDNGPVSGTTYTITAYATDNLAQNDISPASVGSILVDTVGPSVSVTDPANAAIDVTLDGVVTIDWNEDVDCTTVIDANITTDLGTITNTGCSAAQGTFQTGTQAYETVYTIDISTNVKDANGNAMGSLYSFTYKTAGQEVTGFTATDLGTDGNLLLSWTNPSYTGFTAVKIVRAEGAPPPPGCSIGTVVYDGTVSPQTDSGLTNSTEYFYLACTYDSDTGTGGDQYTFGMSTSGIPSSSDSTPPEDTTDLSSTGQTTTSVTLQWTAAGDDGATGTATLYDVRYSTGTLDAASYPTDTQATGEPAPSVGGSTESFTVNSLSCGTTYQFGLKTEDETPNSSALSNVITQATAACPDATPPEDTTDLSSTAQTETSVTLQWTAAGDDGAAGTATLYDVRYSTGTLDAASYPTDTQATGEPAPSVGGSTESFTVNSLSCGTTYQFGLKTEDEIPNSSALSNVLTQATSACTNPEPETAITAPAVSEMVVSDPYTITGTATDDSQITAVYVNIQRSSDSKYWNDIGSTWDGAAPNNTATCLSGGCNASSENWEYTWDLPIDNGPVSGTTYTITALARDDFPQNDSTPASVGSVKVDTVGPSVSSTVPTNAEVDVALNGTVTINWNEDVDCTTVIDANITTNPGTITNTGCAGAQGTFQTGSQVTSTVYTVDVSTSVKDANGNLMGSIYSFTYSTVAPGDTPPETTVDDPSASATLLTTPYTIAGTALDDNLISAVFVNIQRASDNKYWNDTGSTWDASAPNNTATCLTGGCNAATENWEYSWDLPADNASTTYTITAFARDSLAQDDPSPASVASIVVDTVAPTVTSTDPANDAVGIALDGVVTIDWVETMDCTTVIDANITTTLGTLTKIGCGGTQATFQTGSQVIDTSYTVTISTSVKDANGIAMTSAYNFSYTTSGSDATPPDDTVDLSSTAQSETSVSLSWTAPGDDGAVGTATLYDVRYSTGTVSTGSWAGDSQATGEPAPLLAGSTESFTVTGLTCGTTYTFGLKTEDDGSNSSGLSNVITQATQDCSSGFPPNGIFNTSANWAIVKDFGTNATETCAYDGTKTQTADGTGSVNAHADERNDQVNCSITQTLASPVDGGSTINTASIYSWLETNFEGTVDNVSIDLELDDATAVNILDSGELTHSAAWTQYTNAGAPGAQALPYVVPAARTVTKVIIYVDAFAGGNNGAIADHWVDDISITYTPYVDTYAPEDITDLATSNSTLVSVDLDWTAPGDDAAVGTAFTYDIRYSTSTITAGNWASATQVSGEPSPSVASTAESMTVGSLACETTYYFAIKATDESSNTNSLSNVPSATTVICPDFIAPADTTDLSSTAQTDLSVTLSWTAA